MEKSNPSQEFLEKKECLLLEKENIEARHKYKMEEIEAERESARRFHDLELQKIRIKSAEIRKQQMRKAGGDPYRQ